MSLNRAALRLATVMALSNACESPYPTLAENRVFDSRIDPLEGLNEGDLVPTIVVSTDDVTGESLSPNNGGAPWRETVELKITCSIGAVINAADDEDDPIFVITPIESEAEHEMMLDLFEDQIRRSLDRTNVNAWTQRLFDRHVNRVNSLASLRYVERDAQVRIAQREITLQVEMLQPVEQAIAAPGEGVAAIPEPMNSLLADIIAIDGDYAPTAQAMHDALTENGGFQPIEIPPLDTVRLIEGDDGGGFRPDGVAEVDLESA